MAAERPLNALRFAKLALVLFVLSGLGIAYRHGVFDQLGDPQQFAQAVVAMGAWGYVGFILAYTLLQPFGVPGTVFVVAAPLIWPWPIAFALSMVGTMSASVVGFSFSRFIARDWVSARVPERFKKYNAALERNGFRTVVMLRMIFWMPQVLHGFLGVSRVPFWTHFWGSVVGYIPPLLVVSYFASEVFDASGGLQPGAWKYMGGLFAASLVLLLVMRWFERRAVTRSDVA
ncbi:MAG: TVP38/TMEM64 family protein [Myxococcales bacterium]|nr:TVP38/TMEM64 family protein [Myxococcales bacterium]